MNNIEEKTIICPDCGTIETVEFYKDRLEDTFKFKQEENGIYHCNTKCKVLG